VVDKFAIFIMSNGVKDGTFRLHDNATALNKWCEIT